MAKTAQEDKGVKDQKKRRRRRKPKKKTNVEAQGTASQNQVLEEKTRSVEDSSEAKFEIHTLEEGKC